MFRVYVPTLSMNPVIVTFGAGACAMAGGASIPRTATRATARTNSLLRLSVPAEVEEGQTEILVSQIEHRQGGLQDRLAIGGHGVLPAARFGKRRAEVEVRVSPVRIELDGLLQLGDSGIDAAQVQQE